MGISGAPNWKYIKGKPTTVSGYGITDMVSQTVAYATNAGNAQNAVNATNAGNAQNAVNATNATNASYATNAGRANTVVTITYQQIDSANQSRPISV